jgi:hypothetical protein
MITKSNLLSNKDAFKLYSLTRFYPLCAINTVLGFLIPSLIIAFWIKLNYTVTIQKKVKIVSALDPSSDAIKVLLESLTEETLLELLNKK